MPEDLFSFKTIESPSEGLYREKGSRFLAFAYPVRTEADIRQYLSTLQKKYFDARHHCYAWMLGPGGKSYRAFDDGEPNHSAGDPILGQIRSKGITDVLVVVVRYFGGVKLGVGGLISAYRTAADDALSRARVIEKEVTGVLGLSYAYASTPEAMRLVKEFDLNIVSQQFEAGCFLKARYRLRDEAPLVERMDLMKATGTDLSYELLPSNEGSDEVT